MAGRADYDDCVENSLAEFNTYDQYVDVVSCWEEFLSNYRPHFGEYHFDRFPTLPPEGDGDSVTPDFAVYFSDAYGIIFELSRTMPADEESFESELDQLRRYDRDLSFRVGDDEWSTPDRHDIVLLVGSADSLTIGERIADKMNAGGLDLDAGLILLEYTYTGQDKDPGYQFRRIPSVDDNFRDDALPNQMRLSRKMSMKNHGFDNIFVPPDAFFEYKATGVLCNDRPSPVYLACYLWHDVFYDYLDAEQQRVWERGSQRKILAINIDLDQLRDALNDRYIPDGSVRIQWLRDAFEYLAVADLAERTSDDEYEVQYRNLRRRRNKYRNANSERTEFSDLARLFTEYYCSNKVELSDEELETITGINEDSEKSLPDETKQESLDAFE